MEMNDSVEKKLIAVFRDIRISPPRDGRLTINASAESTHDVLKSLKDEGYNHLALISCVDWIDAGSLELAYVLSSYFENEHVILKTIIPRKEPVFETVIDVFENAEPYEREIHELFGVDFKGHPRQLPLFLEREYTIPPFRKDFDTREYVADYFDKIPFVEEER